MNLRNTNILAAVVALELYLVRIIRYNTYAAALRAFYSLARVFIFNIKFLAAVLAGKLNHIQVLQFSTVIITGAPLFLTNITYLS